MDYLLNGHLLGESPWPSQAFNRTARPSTIKIDLFKFFILVEGKIVQELIKSK